MTTLAAEEAKREKVRHTDKAEELKEEIREHVRFCKTNLSNIPQENVTDDYNERMKDMMSMILHYCSNGHFGGKAPANTPISYIHAMICRKHGGAAELMGRLTGPRAKGWTRKERAERDMLIQCFVRATTWVPKPKYQPQWDLPKSDPANDHPGAVLYRERKALAKKETELAKNARRNAENRKKERLLQESKERQKTKKKQRKERQKHFADLEKERQEKRQ